MADDKNLIPEESLKGYKEKINPSVKVNLTWDKELIFLGRTQEGYEMEFDAYVQWGCKPTDSLLLSLAGCMGIDMMMFLQKMKMNISKFKIEMVGERNPTPPQYFKSVEMVIHMVGSNLNKKKIDHAISLSREKYCSVYNSLRKDLELGVRYFLEEEGSSDPLDQPDIL
jgi:putative redox protein